LGEILVEVMAAGRGQTFLEPGTLMGPYPSGAPAIFIGQVARLGQPCGMIGCVCDDDFGVLNVERLRADGVDVSAIGVHRDAPTGSAFVTYQANGDRLSSSTFCTALLATSRLPTRRTRFSPAPITCTSWGHL
jgi:sugar/nucleoside kinase (ribokinase family)